MIPLSVLEEIRNVLKNNISWSPFDFIRGISLEGDKGIFINHLTSKLNEENDLRFIYTLSDGTELTVFAARLPWDSNFFRYGVAKLDGIFPLSEPYYRPYADYTAAIETLIKLSKEKKIKYLFANVNPRDLALIHSLGNLGFSLIETRAYYHRDIRDYEYRERYQVRVAEEKDIESLGDAAVKMVNMYDRFHSDPFIAPEDANRLMYKWVEASIRENFADVTIVPNFPKPTAFCTVRYHKDKWVKWKLNLSQSVVLGAVGPEYRGWYRKLISEINYHLNEMGAEHAYVSTQVTNKPAVHTFESLGYRFGRCEHVFRMVL
jgi:hypothetical protein